jgi:tetratricopeptide (TPR) repeat protein
MMANEKGQAVYSFLGYAIIVMVILGAFFVFPWSDSMKPAKDPSLNEAREALSKRQWNTALNLYSRAIEAKPTNAAAYLGRARANAELGNLDQALSDVNQAIKVEPKNPASLGQRGVILKMQGKLDEADRSLSAAIRYNNRYAWAVAQRADVLMRKGKGDEALQEVSKAVRMDRNLVGGYRLRAWILTNAGKCKEAAEDFKKVEDLGSNDAWSLQDKAWFLLTCPDETVRDTEKANQLAQKAFELSGGRSGVVLETMAEVNFRKGDPLKAAELQKKAIELEQRRCPDGSCVEVMKERLNKYEMASRQELRPRQEMLPLGTGQ